MGVGGGRGRTAVLGVSVCVWWQMVVSVGVWRCVVGWIGEIYEWLVDKWSEWRLKRLIRRWEREDGV